MAVTVTIATAEFLGGEIERRLLEAKRGENGREFRGKKHRVLRG